MVKCAFLALILYSINQSILPPWLWTTFWVFWFIAIVCKVLSEIPGVE